MKANISFGRGRVWLFLVASVGVLSAWSVLAQDVPHKFRFVRVAVLEQWMADPRASLAVYDANSKRTREKDGMIPGARALTSHSKYDVAKELPESRDIQLVFYCANEMCTASHQAAERASAAGYKNVYVLSDGIQGWVREGKKVVKPPKG